MSRSSIRVLYVADTVLPSRRANTLQSMRLVEALQGCGAEVRFIARSVTAPTAQIREHYGITSTVDVRSAKISPRFGRSWRLAAFVVREIWHETWDVVHTRSEKVALCVLLATRSPVLLELHNPLRSLLLRRWPTRRGRLRLAAISSELRTELSNRTGVDQSEIPLIRSAAASSSPIEHNDRPCAGGDTSRRLIAGYAGHLYPGKGMELLAPIAQRCPDIDFVVLGGDQADIESWRARLGDHQNIDIRGYIPPSEVAEALRLFDIALLPNQAVVRPAGSLSGDIGRWTSPLKAFEYLAAGIAIVASDLPVLREIFVHESTAILCDPGEPEEWSAAVTRLAADPELREALGRRAREEHRLKHSWAARAAEVLEVLEDLVHRTDRESRSRG